MKIELVASGDPADFGTAVLLAVAAAFARHLGLDPRLVRVILRAAGSVVLEVTIDAPSPAVAEAINVALTPVMRDATSASTFLRDVAGGSISVESDPVVAVVYADGGNEPVAAGDGLVSGGGANSGLVTLVILLLLVVGCGAGGYGCYKGWFGQTKLGSTLYEASLSIGKRRSTMVVVDDKVEEASKGKPAPPPAYPGVEMSAASASSSEVPVDEAMTKSDDDDEKADEVAKLEEVSISVSRVSARL